jgi:DNA processing protein
MLYSNNAINILAAKAYKGIGRAWIVKNMKFHASIEDIVCLLNRDTKENFRITIQDFEEKRQNIEQSLQRMNRVMDGVVAVGDEDFPAHRGNVKNSERPVVMFYRGDIHLLHSSNKNFAVIGLLDPDNDIESVEQDVVKELVKNGVTIISGLAQGCDSIAHRQALLSNGKTVAILPSPLNHILPEKNEELANEIVESGGLLVTEYDKDARSVPELRGRYQERDRLQALFSDGVILAASYAKNDAGLDSGSRLAMDYAASYSIPRAVIYDSNRNARNAKFDLNKQLVKEEKDITILARNNFVSTIQKLTSIERRLSSQLSMFNSF